MKQQVPVNGTHSKQRRRAWVDDPQNSTLIDLLLAAGAILLATGAIAFGLLSGVVELRSPF